MTRNQYNIPFVGVFVGSLVGVAVGPFVGVFVGVALGTFVGVFVGIAVGPFVGVLVGVVLGTFVETLVGVVVGVFEGTLVGVNVGTLVGAFVGAKMQSISKFLKIMGMFHFEGIKKLLTFYVGTFFFENKSFYRYQRLKNNVLNKGQEGHFII